MPENEANVKGLFLHPNQLKAFAALPGDVVKQVVMAAYAYMNDQSVPFSDPLAEAFFSVIAPSLDFQKKQQSNGSKGGRPKTKTKPNQNPNETQTKPKPNPSETQAEPNAKPNKNLETRNKNQEEINTHPPTPLKGGGAAGEGEKPSRSRETAATIRAAIDERVESPELREALRDFAEMRERMKKPLTLKALSLTLRDLTMLASTDADRVAIVEQSIQRGWLGMFAKHDDTGNNSRASPQPQRPQAKPGDFDPDRQAQIMRNVLARHMAREAQEAKQ